MTGYFDDASHAVREISRDLLDDEFLRQVAEIEKPIVLDVLLNTGDRQFPDDLREKILNIIAVKGLITLTKTFDPMPDAREHVLTMRYSELIEDLHSAFHALASRREPCRWGRWSDSPRQNLISRKDHDEPEGEEHEGVL